MFSNPPKMKKIISLGPCLLHSKSWTNAKFVSCLIYLFRKNSNISEKILRRSFYIALNHSSACPVRHKGNTVTRISSDTSKQLWSQSGRGSHLRPRRGNLQKESGPGTRSRKPSVMKNRPLPLFSLFELWSELVLNS